MPPNREKKSPIEWIRNQNDFDWSTLPTPPPWQQVLERMWRKGNPSALLVGMQTGAAIVENSMEFPQKTKNGTAF